jgi:hypothetical protein
VAGAEACQFAKIRNFYSLCQMRVDVSNDTSKLPWASPRAQRKLRHVRRTAADFVACARPVGAPMLGRDKFGGIKIREEDDGSNWQSRTYGIPGNHDTAATLLGMCATRTAPLVAGWPASNSTSVEPLGVRAAQPLTCGSCSPEHRESSQCPLNWTQVHSWPTLGARPTENINISGRRHDGF